MTTQTNSIAVAGMDAVSAVSGQVLSLFPDIQMTSADGSLIDVTLLIPATDGDLSVAALPTDIYATLIQRSDVSTSVVTFDGAASQVAAALSKITLTPTDGLTSAVASTYQLILANDVQRSYLDGNITISPASSVVTPTAPSPTVGPTSGGNDTTAATFTETGASYVVSNSATATTPATIDVGITASTVTNGGATLNFTGGNSTLNLTGGGSTTVQSLGGNTINVASSTLTYVSGGDSTINVASGSVSIVGSSGSNLVDLKTSSTGTVDIAASGPSATVLFGGAASLNYTGSNGTIVLNGSGMTGSAVIDSSGNNTVWAGAGDLIYRAGGAGTLHLGSGSSTVTGGDTGSSTLIDAGTGGLTYEGGEGTATVHGGTSQSTIQGGSGTLVLDGGNETTTLTTGDAQITGGVVGTNNVVNNGSGRLSYQGGSGESVVNGGAGSDTVHAGSGGGWFGAGSDGNSYLEAQGGATFLQGAANGDTLVGASGGDTWIQAGVGNETLYGANSSGTVTMQLSSGADHVFLDKGASIITTGTGTATISGGSGYDTIAIGTQSGRVTFTSIQGEHTTISGFRVGTDHLVLSGETVKATSVVGGSTIVSLSGGGSITLSHLQHAGVAGLFG